MASYISYLRIPAMASSAIAVVLSGALYFKQKWAGVVISCTEADGNAASSFIHGPSRRDPGRMKVYHAQLNLEYQITMTSVFRLRTASP